MSKVYIVVDHNGRVFGRYKSRNKAQNYIDSYYQTYWNQGKACPLDFEINEEKA